MRYIDQLLQGAEVKWKKLGEVCSIKTGKGITKKDAATDGRYPIISGGKTPMGYIDVFNRQANTVTVSRVGANAGFVSYITECFYLNDKCFSAVPKESCPVIGRFLYYALKSQEERLSALQSEGGVPTINTRKLGSLLVPLPPLHVQQEIVRILDKFTELETELEAKLETELELRKQQYERYRDQLLAPDKGLAETEVKWKKLGEIAKNLDSMRKPITSGLRRKGMIPYYGASGIVDYIEGYIFDGDFLLVSEDGANLLARNTPIAFSVSGKSWVNNHAHVLQFNTYAARKFVEYYLNNMDLTPYISGAAQPKLNKKNLNRILIPQPPLHVQQRIVSLLDKFHTLTTSISERLPRELELRKQQYAYYRDQLLAFER